jgi:predicted small metal-binding protein
MKTLACGDLVPGCQSVVAAETDEEILRIAAQHAVEAHGMTVDDELVAAVKGAIRSQISAAVSTGRPAVSQLRTA